MERNFTDENFEHFLKQNADGLRMRPPDKVWKGISNRINKRKRRFGFFLSLSLVTAAVIGYFTIEQSAYHTHTIARKADVQPGLQRNTASLLPSKQEQPGKTAVSSTEKGKVISISNTQIISLSNPALHSNDLNKVQTEETAALAPADEFTPTIVDSDPEKTSAIENTPALQNKQEHKEFPQSIESVVNLYKPRSGSKKIGWQIYFTPTVSYRKLGENKSYLRSVPANSIPYTYPSVYDINNVVTHKPDFGFEIGLTGKYPLSDKVKLRGGFQFNVSRYGIKAFNSPYQMATITLNTGNGVQSLSTITSLNNFNGYNPSWLENFYFQASVPVGVELKIRGDEKMQFGVATTIQPTYVLSDRAYIISTDYKNYAQIPSLTRKWNVNTSLETFVAYSTGHLKWQVGPQVRYQLLSSFVNKYPVKENLFDFGLKVGISLNKH